MDEHAEILNRAIQEVMKTITNVRFRIVLIKRDEETIIPSRDVKLQPGDQIVVIARPDGIGRILELTGKDKTRFKNIMILGGGKIGRMCASVLEKKFNVKLIESDLKKAYELSDYLSETLILQGDGRDIQLLMDESIGEMDAFIAVTEDSETNIISCLMAREMGVVKTIAHVENAEYNQLTRVIGINALVNKKMITAANITRLVRKTNIVALTHVHGMDAEVLEYVVPPESRITQKDVRNLKFPRGAILGGYVRGDDVGIVVGDTRIQSQDRVVVFSLPHCIQQVEAFFR
ncbi:MAG: NAD-binding protein [Leptospiraceae bacterium]|nr:NAD-binding protein [Leptospiraceae bacterium]